MLDYIISNASIDDAEELLSLRASIDAENPCFIPVESKTIADEIKTIRYFTGHDDGLYLKAVHKKNMECIGFLTCKITKPNITNLGIYGIGILNKHKRMKVGTRLLNTAIDFAISHKLKTVDLYVEKTNKYALEFYKKIGFRYVIGDYDDMYRLRRNI